MFLLLPSTVVPPGAPESAPTYIYSGVGKPPGMHPQLGPRYTMLDPPLPAGTTAVNLLHAQVRDLRYLAESISQAIPVKQ